MLVNSHPVGLAVIQRAQKEVEEFGPFASTTVRNKYAHTKKSGYKESWQEISARVAAAVVRPYLPHLESAAYRLILQRKLMPGGRYLYASGRRFPQIANCLGGDTRIITKEGVRTLEELVGMEFEVLNRYGLWEKATAACFGSQMLYEVTFSNGCTVQATAGHRWWQRDGSRVTTEELVEVPLAAHAELPQVAAEGVRHGIIYGDGTLTNKGRYSGVTFFTDKKAELAACFEKREMRLTVGNGGYVDTRTHRTHNGLPAVYLQPAHYKSLPGEDGQPVSPSYARGFIAGLIATDGHVKGRRAYISCEHWGRAEKIRELAVLGGCQVVDMRVFSTVSPFDGGPREGVLIAISAPTAPVIRSDHREWKESRDKPRRTHKSADTTEHNAEVISVRELEEDAVYCCVVPGSESFTLANGLITSNCFLYRAEDSREGWAELLNKCAHSLMTGGGVGVVYSEVRPADSDIHGMGGKSTGPIALMNMINECGRHIVQGGSRRSALWAGLHWWHPDVFRFITCKRYSALIKECKERDFNFPAPMDGTNISVITDDDFFAAMNDVSWSKEYRLWGTVHTVNHAWAKRVYEQVTFGMCTDGEPGLSVDTGEHAGECLRNACLTGDTLVAVADGRGAVPIRDLVGLRTAVYASDGRGGIVRAVMRNVRVTRKRAAVVRVTLDDGSSVRVTPDHLMMLANGSFAEAGTLTPGTCLMPFFSQVRQDYRRVRCRRKWVKQCLLVTGRAACERDGYDVHHMNGDHLDDRPENLELVAHGEHAALKMRGDANPARRLGYDHAWLVRRSLQSTGVGNGRYVDGARVQPRALASHHTDVLPPRGVQMECEECGKEFYARPGARTCSRSCGATLGVHDRRQYSHRTVTSVVPDGVEDVYDGTVDGPHCFAVVTKGGEAENLRAGAFSGVVVHNCTEVTSKDDGDSCNLASLNLARIESADELAWATEVGTAFLLCGTLYGKMPLQKLYQTREKNRRLGLGLMGVHEWLLQRGRRYGPDAELAQWLTGYVQSGEHAARYADVLGISTPVATRSIAPTGTISIIAETTSGIEPLYAAAYKRRYLDGPTWKAQYVVDATAKRIVERHGVDPEQLEDAVTLSEDVGRRIQFQEWMQKHVDHAISSTINLPSWGSSLNSADTLPRFAATLLKHLPGLRGITAYPDGSRGGQPLNRVPYAEAAAQVGVELVEGNEHACKGGVCGT